jgi:hypothetical protein
MFHILKLTGGLIDPIQFPISLYARRRYSTLAFLIAGKLLHDVKKMKVFL